jgi:hypothetical protein
MEAVEDYGVLSDSTSGGAFLFYFFQALCPSKREVEATPYSLSFSLHRNTITFLG